MRISIKQLRRIIKEEVTRLHETPQQKSYIEIQNCYVFGKPFLEKVDSLLKSHSEIKAERPGGLPAYDASADSWLAMGPLESMEAFALALDKAVLGLPPVNMNYILGKRGSFVESINTNVVDDE